MAEASNSKKNNYREISQIGVGERARKRMFECLMCSRVVASKHSIEKHLATQHNLSPVKRLKKLYRYDENVPVPTRTLYRWKSSRKILKENADQGQSIDEPLPDFPKYVEERAEMKKRYENNRTERKFNEKWKQGREWLVYDTEKGNMRCAECGDYYSEKIITEKNLSNTNTFILGCKNF
ncbi:uncharacterized protein LOC132722601 [Ruditapes philippinarum]|uniref:uncharacterized protein LOC132722601 n=1 Tax=Ruditapes philippinarum TaxID=129788 RepID=UPI00295BB4A3|nr:uncharacterized protein LOC132722601 [Ruditapes philippinarum]